MTRSPNNLSPEDRLNWYGWTVVQRDTPYAEGPCWEWNGPKHSCGYGNIRTKTPDGRQTFARAHRVSLEVFLGYQIARNLHVLHSCDNPPCVNPRHLRTGTDTDNTQDRVSHNRHRSGKPMVGEKNPVSKLTETNVQEIRERLAKGETQTRVGRLYGVSQSAVSKIVTGRAWTHI